MAGFFGLFDYTKPGPGVPKDQPEKRRFFQYFEIFFGKFWKLVILNLLYVAFCIPIVTIGPATAAMFYVLRNYNQRRHVFLPSDFIDSFKKNFKQGFVVWLLDLAAILLLAYNYFFWTGDVGLPSLLTDIAFAVLVFISVILLFMNYYIFTLISSFYMTLKQVIKNSFIFAVIGLWRNLFITLILAVIGLLCFTFYGIATILALIILFSFTAFTVSFLIYPVIKRYLIDPVLEEEEKKRREEEEAYLESGEDPGQEDEIIFEDKG